MSYFSIAALQKKFVYCILFAGNTYPT